MGGDEYWCQRWCRAPGSIDEPWTWNRIAFLGSLEEHRALGRRLGYVLLGDEVHSVRYLYKILDECFLEHPWPVSNTHQKKPSCWELSFKPNLEVSLRFSAS